jgi:hypothetical protein
MPLPSDHLSDVLSGHPNSVSYSTCGQEIVRLYACDGQTDVCGLNICDGGKHSLLEAGRHPVKVSGLDASLDAEQSVVATLDQQRSHEFLREVGPVQQQLELEDGSRH